MSETRTTSTRVHNFAAKKLDALLDALRQAGYEIIGPTRQDGAIMLGKIESAADLPAGWTDVQAPGMYRLERREEGRLFGFGPGPQAWKQFLHTPAVRLWEARKNGAGFQISTDDADPPKMAFLGVRACDLHAIQLQDTVLQRGTFRDPAYSRRRENSFIVAVNCTRAGDTCFCTSMGTGPAVESGYDLAMTEIFEPDRHFFLLEAGSEAGQAVVDALAVLEPASPAERRRARAAVAAAAREMGRQVNTRGLGRLLRKNYEHPHWQEVASRCLACGNCTLVCPTCFCTTVQDTTDLTGTRAERWRVWDSCFTTDFSYIHGGSIRRSGVSRYRQWLTHKFATWNDQFGQSGCVGCGRCITWCPAAIDITQELATLRQREKTVQVKQVDAGAAERTVDGLAGGEQPDNGRTVKTATKMM